MLYHNLLHISPYLHFVQYAETIGVLSGVKLNLPQWMIVSNILYITQYYIILHEDMTLAHNYSKRFVGTCLFDGKREGLFGLCEKRGIEGREWVLKGW